LQRQAAAHGIELEACRKPARRSYVGFVFGRTGCFDQFSTLSPLKRAKSLSFVVASTSPFTWAIAAI
jgi:hypothetical protein